MYKVIFILAWRLILDKLFLKYEAGVKLTTLSPEKTNLKNPSLIRVNNLVLCHLWGRKIALTLQKSTNLSSKIVPSKNEEFKNNFFLDDGAPIRLKGRENVCL